MCSISYLFAILFSLGENPTSDIFKCWQSFAAAFIWKNHRQQALGMLSLEYLLPFSSETYSHAFDSLTDGLLKIKILQGLYSVFCNDL